MGDWKQATLWVILVVAITGLGAAIAKYGIGAARLAAVFAIALVIVGLLWWVGLLDEITGAIS